MTSIQSTAPKRSTPTRPGDRIFRGTSVAAALMILATLAGVGLFLTIEGIPGVLASPDEVKHGTNFVDYVVPLVFGTLLAAILALVMAVPVAIGVALYISHYAPHRLATTLGYIIDLLAAVPSVVYGVWGISFLAPSLVPAYVWLEDRLGLSLIHI